MGSGFTIDGSQFTSPYFNILVSHFSHSKRRHRHKVLTIVNCYQFSSFDHLSPIRFSGYQIVLNILVKMTSKKLLHYLNIALRIKFIGCVGYLRYPSARIGL